MNIIPVLDLMNGEVVHAKHGNRHQYLPIKSVLTNSSNPLEVAQALLALYPFKQLYIADINAIQKNGNHADTILEISAKFPALIIWLDAGLDEADALKNWQNKNIEVILGSESLKSLPQYHALLSASQHQAILSLDYKGDVFQGIPELINSPNWWPNNLIMMTLNKVGSGTGPDLQKLSAIKKLSAKSCVYAAGGIRNSADLERLLELGIDGALVASALHSGALSHQQIKKLQN